MSVTSRYPSVVERYFTKHYFKSAAFKFLNPDEDLCVLAHSNRVCLITLAPNHKALHEGPIQSVSFTINGKDFHKGNKAHGKKKLDAIKIAPHSIICEVVSGNGTKYSIRGAIFGKICEINENLIIDPTLLNRMPDTNGYIAIVLHKFCLNHEVCKNLLTEEQYFRSDNMKDTMQSDMIATMSDDNDG